MGDLSGLETKKFEEEKKKKNNKKKILREPHRHNPGNIIMKFV